MGFIFGCLLAAIDLWLLWIISVTWWLPNENPWSKSLFDLAIRASIGTVILSLWFLTRSRLLGQKCLPKVLRFIFLLPYVSVIVLFIPLFESLTNQRERTILILRSLANVGCGYIPGFGATWEWGQEGAPTRVTISPKNSSRSISFPTKMRIDPNSLFSRFSCVSRHRSMRRRW